MKVKSLEKCHWNKNDDEWNTFELWEIDDLQVERRSVNNFESNNNNTRIAIVTQ